MAAPRTVQQQAPPPPAAVQQQRQPGLFSQMASTAAGVAIGSAAGHTIANGLSGIFGGGSSAPATYEAQPEAAQPLQKAAPSECEFDARGLTECLDNNGGDMRVCQWYVDQLKSCLSASQGN